MIKNDEIITLSHRSVDYYGGKLYFLKRLQQRFPVLTVSCDSDEIIVHTNAFFAPFEYYEGEEIVGVDVEIMNMVGEKMGKKVTFKNVEFSAIIDIILFH